MNGKCLETKTGEIRTGHDGYDVVMRSRRERLILFGVFALAIGVAIAHEYRIPSYCLRYVSHIIGR